MQHWILLCLVCNIHCSQILLVVDNKEIPLLLEDYTISNHPLELHIPLQKKQSLSNVCNHIHYIPFSDQDVYAIALYSKEHAIDYIFVNTTVMLSKGLINFLELHAISCFGAYQEHMFLENNSHERNLLLDNLNIAHLLSYSCNAIDEIAQHITNNTLTFPLIIKNNFYNHSSIIFYNHKEFYAWYTHFFHDDHIYLQTLYTDTPHFTVQPFINNSPIYTLLLLSDGTTIIPLVTAETNSFFKESTSLQKIYKTRIYHYNHSSTHIIMSAIVDPILQLLTKQSDRAYKGILELTYYIDTQNNPVILDINCHIKYHFLRHCIYHLKNNFLTILHYIKDQKLNEYKPEWDKRSTKEIILELIYNEYENNT